MVSCHWHIIQLYVTVTVGLGNYPNANQAEVNVCEVLEVNITFFASKSSYCKGAPQKSKPELSLSLCTLW